MSTPRPDPDALPTRQTPEEMRAWLALLETANHVQHATDRRVREAVGVSFAQLEILARIAEAGEQGMRMTDIANTLVVSRSGLTYQIRQLEKLNLVSRAPSRDDERSVIARITPDGLRCVIEAAPHYVEVVKTLFLDHVSADDLTVLADILDGVRDKLRSLPGRSELGR
ncbi:DNA-binding MarR family transcriptional regulator [Glaciihabitans tibetensis]|uniref:DNA-binding MarR family transcriptional regulator n=1 Tax=Glaciihabitans tibetensis TaxID=1266600 RepID=A0A2T0VIQ7_9MICO|nr:MarR family transcriptional regulator [Glaciihabitans tibetensis]PRY70101.1 DNA-binding MarR family transcriptional regulator [Glaciihabitans tibetensis]